MTSTRQNELFAGEDWRVIYRAFTQVNFNATDPQSIARALRDYLRENYPEDYNDWIESAEWVSIIELLAWLAGTLAFRTDIAARENFLETAEGRDSILRLARFLSYNPRRNQPARGLVKLVAVATDDDVTDGFGATLSGTTVQWNDPDDTDWFDKFVTIMNAAMVGTNQYGTPLKTATVSGVRTQLYRLNNRMVDSSMGFSADVSGETMAFELCNGDFAADSGYFERSPNPDAAYHLYFRSDGSGNGSPNTGFFMLFKQGTLGRQTFNIVNPVENQVLDIDASGVNQSDVWVQNVSDSGAVISEWTKVPAVFSDNITFNSISAEVRDIYSVITRDQDRISIRFADGRFGSVPVGNIRVWYRVSNGLQYTIRPHDIDRITVPVRYFNRAGVLRTLSLTFSLMLPVTNAAPRETEDQIRRRAPAVYSAQSRMVSGEDYNSFPLQSNLAVKLKALNRVYSGHSRFIDLNDPTGNYQDTVVFSDDGILLREDRNTYAEVPLSLNRTPEEVVAHYIQPVLRSDETRNYVREVLLNEVQAGNVTVPDGIVWYEIAGDARFTGTGYLTNTVPRLAPGATLLMVLPDGTEKWVAVVSVSPAYTLEPPPGSRGPLVLAESIPSGTQVKQIIPRYAETLDGTLTAVQEKVRKNLSFTLWYDYATATWTIDDPSLLSAGPAINGTLIKIATVDYLSASLWRCVAKGVRYVFESETNVEWFYGGQIAVDERTGLQARDRVTVLKYNDDLRDIALDGTPTGRSLRREFGLSISKLYYYSDGTPEPRRITVTFADTDEDGYPDDPDTFFKLMAVRPQDRLLFWRTFTDGEGQTRLQPIETVVVFETANARTSAAAIQTGTIAFQLNDNTFWRKTLDGWVRDTQYRYGTGRGPNVAARWVLANGQTAPAALRSRIAFRWNHYAPSDHRIDPSQTSIIDMFVLTSEYDYLTRQWIANGTVPADVPEPPTELDLRLAFNEYEDFKVFSDTIVWRPVRYKFLFGEGAEPEFRAQFKVIKLPDSPYSDGEIKSRVVRAINEFFDVTRWDFGETFYATELIAYLHAQLATIIGSVVPVPVNEASAFGEGFEVRCRSDEIFISTAQVHDVVIINSNTAANLRIR